MHEDEIMILIDETKLSDGTMCKILVDLGVDVSQYMERKYTDEEVEEKLKSVSQDRDRAKYLTFKEAFENAQVINYKRMRDSETGRLMAE